jgi:hypothetical protein
LYVLGGRFRTVKLPDASVTDANVNPRVTSVIVTFAFGITAPVGSATVPLIEPVYNCAHEMQDTSNTLRKASPRRDKAVFIVNSRIE